MLLVEKLSKSFNNKSILKNVSFKLNDGETLVIVGKSGSGKTTLLRLLNNLEKADSGTISNSTFGLVFQEFNLFPQYNVLENVMLAPKLLNVKANPNKLLKQLELINKKKSYPKELSGGEKQRVAIARALINKPNVLCLDEPTSALDQNLTKEIVEILKSLKGKQTMIIVTHNMEFCNELADVIGIMENGKLKIKKQQGKEYL